VAAYMQYLLTLTPAQLAVLANQMVPQQQPVRQHRGRAGVAPVGFC